MGGGNRLLSSDQLAQLLKTNEIEVYILSKRGWSDPTPWLLVKNGHNPIHPATTLINCNKTSVNRVTQLLTNVFRYFRLQM